MQQVKCVRSPFVGRYRISAETTVLGRAVECVFTGRFREAHAAAQQHLQSQAGDPQAALVLAQIAIEHDNVPGATKLARLVRSSGHRSAWLDAIEARLALMQQDAPAARAAARTAMQQGTDNPHIAAQIGVVLARTGLHTEAAAMFEQAARGAPDNAGYLYNLAIEQQFNGDLDRARKGFERLTRMAPDHAQAWLALLGMTDEPPLEWRTALERLYDDRSDPETRLLSGHALARWFEAHGCWDESFEWLERAKAGKAAATNHSRLATDELFAAAEAAAADQAQPDANGSDPGPIFVVGMPRSGTTLVERIIAAHPQVRSLGELSDFGIALKRFLGTPGPHVLDAELIAAAAARDLRAVGEAYIQAVASLAGEYRTFTDKMPFNFFYAPAILRALPSARIVCLQRSPADVLFANYRQLFATGFSYYSYNYDFADAAHFVARFEALCSVYREHLPPDRFTTVRYENVVGDQEAETRRLLAFCGLDWDDRCLSPHRGGQAVATASAVQVRAPVNARSVGRWRRYGAAASRAEAELAKYGIAPLT